MARCTAFGTGQAGCQHHNTLLLDGVGSFNDGAAAALNGGGRYDRGFDRCAVSELQINNLRSCHLHADSGKKAVATGLIVTCLGVSSAGATALVTTAACSGALGGEKRTAAEAGNDKTMSQTPSRTLSAQKAFFHS